MNLNSKRVAVVGAGPAGLTAAKSLLEQGLIPTLFEKNSQIGGIWNENDGYVWNTMHTNLSKYFVSFSDFPWPKETILLPHSSEVLKYLINYMKHFNIEQYIKYNSNVIYVTQLNDKKWLVRWKNTINNEIDEDVFDCLILSNGVFNSTYTPKYKNIDKFQGQVVHSRSYNAFKNNSNLNEKCVLVVGHSFSGVDISSDLANQGANVVNVFRKPHWILKGLIKLNPESSAPGLPADLLFVSRNSIDQSRKKAKEDDFAFRNSILAKICAEQNNYPALFIDPNSKSPPIRSVSTGYMNNIKAGKIIPKRQEIVSFEETGIILDDDTHVPADIVVFCTGYRLDLSYVDKKILDIMDYDYNDPRQPLILYKASIHLDIENFACVGLVIETAFFVLELQARWASLIFSGKIELPSREKFLNALNKEREIRNSKIIEQVPRSNFISFSDDIAEEIGALPNLDDLRQTEQNLFKLFWDGPPVPAHYRFSDNKELMMSVLTDLEEEIKTNNAV